MKSEYTTYCEGETHLGSRRVESRIYWEKIKGRWVWLCARCLEAANMENKQETPKELWQILVPKSNGEGEIDVTVHNIWDGKVRAITGGLTVHRSATGNWISPKGELVVERMIPVAISCTEDQMHEIALMTKAFYVQEKVMYYRVSDKVFIV
jgi:hypothetical protein